MDALDLLKKAAPRLAAAAAGPAGLAGMAIKTAAEALGAPGQTGEAVTAALIGASPEQMAALRQADNEFKARMQELGYKSTADLEALAVADRKDARGMQVAKPSIMPALLTTGVGLAFALALGALFWIPIPEANRDVIVYMCGQLAAAFAACLAFWVGTTRSSADKTAMLAQAQPIER